MQKAIRHDKLGDMKTAKTFRLSEQAVKRLQTLKEQTGTNETAILEIALALFERSIIEGIVSGTLGGVPSRERGVAPNVPEDPNSLIEQAERDEMLSRFPVLKGIEFDVITPHRKKRKRK